MERDFNIKEIVLFLKKNKANIIMNTAIIKSNQVKIVNLLASMKKDRTKLKKESSKV